MRAKLFLVFVIVAISVAGQSYSQSPTPAVEKVVPLAAPAGNDAMAAHLKVMRDLKSANEEILKRQKAALETLDELQKAADQIKVFTKRT